MSIRSVGQIDAPQLPNFEHEYETGYKDRLAPGETLIYNDHRDLDVGTCKAKYVGSILNDQRHGVGLTTFDNGREHKGEWRNG